MKLIIELWKMSTEETKTYLHNLIDSCPDYYSKEKIFIHII